ncbi:hypothetical protein VSS37_00035 [Candidatus Thiothrix sp. Deng01]|uniref:Uncharacterized protein n=1 Tax=Candidatus Thiothrix phosphatis TaxID=3112415 RepID=A0ABU6CTE9_9GAMM|nr:hypothetical protein [Candidatus Thiothrix sp. Deng01]MEB4589357.1 hypothetical protein [Candidatus Thiothrix sp. Deng01]
MAGKVKTIEVYYWTPSDWTTDKSEADLQAELDEIGYSTATVPADVTHTEISALIRGLRAGRITANET